MDKTDFKEEIDNISNPEQSKKLVDLCPDVKSFQTDHGSVYEKTADGTFRRHKYDGTEHEPMEWTLFTDKEGDKDIQMARVKISLSKMTKRQQFFMLIEFGEDGNGKKMISTRDEIIDPKDDFDLITFETDGVSEPEMALQTPVTFIPKIGYSVFEISGNSVECHHGDLVSSIETIQK